MLLLACRRVASGRVSRIARTVTSDIDTDRYLRFFNREKELEELGTRIREKGNFLNVQGPPDCGKSALVAHSLDQLEGDPQGVGKPSIVRVDLRGDAFNSVAEFSTMLSLRFASVHKVRVLLIPSFARSNKDFPPAPFFAL